MRQSRFRLVSVAAAMVVALGTGRAADAPAPAAAPPPTVPAVAAPANPRPVVAPGYDDTPMLPNSEWRVHDNRRPLPPVVDAGTAGTQEQPARPPADAIVLFDGTDLSKWQTDKGAAPAWKVENGYMQPAPKAGSIRTRDEFGDCQLHIEWCAPLPPKGDSQGRGNSGVFFMGRYEIQVLDSYESKTYADGQAAALYGQKPPDVNACRKPGEWQTYDVVFTAPVFKDGAVAKPAYVTLFHNGLLVHNHVELLGASGHRTLPKYQAHGPKGSISLQDHNNPVRFRNIWIRPLDAVPVP